MKRRYLPNSKTCFACGEENLAGLRLRFYVEGEWVRTDFDPKPHHCGYPNVVHGGVVAALLDETMGWAANRALARMTITGDLSIRFILPAPGDRRLRSSAQVIRAGKRLASVAGELTDTDGVVYARAEGRFVPLSEEQSHAIDAHLIYRGDEERLFRPSTARPS